MTSDTPRMLAAYNSGSCASESLDPVMDEGCKLERELAKALAALIAIRDATHKSAVALRGIADDALQRKDS